MNHKYRVSHLGLKDGVIIDFDNLEDAGQVARLLKKGLRMNGYPVRKVEVKPIYIPEIKDNEEENSD